MDEIKNCSGFSKKIDLSKLPSDYDRIIEEKERLQEELEKAEHYRAVVPERYWKESLKTFRTETKEQIEALKTTMSFIQAVRCGKFCTLNFLGTVGTGKTHLACSIIRECGGIYTLSPNIVEEIRKARSFSSKASEKEVLNYYGQTKLLVIDEIGRGSYPVEEQYMLYQIINERYNRRKPSVFISNQTKKDFLDYIGTAATDRLTESAKTVVFAGASYRATIRRNFSV
ncbi:ATP-binding protein [Treponema pectinovorum]|uniref:ATP-binding protein n=1 Tax=Treponema pectinovorum TaxID=164 RepID=UPI0011CBCF91|nr:ATP-binding protein [Treponema pectinovorum]